jgi:ABC-type multidrug transport system fused ATPase/permease subunit
MSTEFNIKTFIYDFLSIKKHVILLLSAFIIAFHSYITTIKIPNLLLKINLSNYSTIIIVIVYLFIFIALNIFHTYLTFLISNNIHIFTYNYLFKKILKVREDNLDTILQSSIFVSIVNFVNYFEDAINISITVLPFLLSIIMIFIFIIINLNLLLAILFFIVIIIQMVYLINTHRKSAKYSYLFNNKRNELVNYNVDINKNMDQIIGLNNLDNELNNIKLNSIKVPYYLIKGNKLYFKIFFLLNLLNFIYFFGSTYFLIKHKYSIVSTFFLVFISYHCIFCFQIKNIGHIVYKCAIVISSYNNIQDNISSIQKRSQTKSSHDNIKMIYTNNENIDLIIKNLNFSYNNNIIFDNFNLKLKLEQSYALVGKIGSGKSTLLKILFGINSFTEGDIYLKNKVLNDKEYREWRKNFFYFRQDSTIFERSIIENIFYPKKMYNEKDITLLKQVGIYDEIKNLMEEKKNETKINLSGGQKQIVLLTRILFNPKQIILLDEPTASLDSKTKIFTFNIIKYLKSIKSTLIIATHDIELINIVDEVIDLNKIKKSN